MPIWKTGIATSRATIVISALLLCVSCGPPEQGYWTKPGFSQALTDEQYAADFQHCERFAAQNDGRESEKARTKRYTKCMSARGGLDPEVNQSITREDSSHQSPANLPPDSSHQSNEQRLVNDRECRQQAAATLSSPYAVYVSCMQEKRWSSPPALGAIADSDENEKPDPNTGHAQEDVGRQSIARDIGDENPKNGSAIGDMDSAENGKPEPSNALERIGLGVQNTAGNIASGMSKIGLAIGRPLEAIGRGVQSVFTKIGDEISKSGSRIGNIFKQLSGKDTRDKDKEKASNKLVAPPPQDEK